MLLAMHYCVNIDTVFASVVHIIQDVNNGHVLQLFKHGVCMVFFSFG